MRKGMVVFAAVVFLVVGLSVAYAERSGKEVYESRCSVCHGSGVMGAPMYGSGAWAELLEKDGLDRLVSEAMEGKGSMPAKGGCGDCTDAEIRAAVQYMVDSAK